MPGGNGRGPAGMGPRTGWGRGACAPIASAEQPFTDQGFGRGGGQGRRNQFRATGLTGFQRTHPASREPDAKGQSESLKVQVDQLTSELEAIRSQLKSLSQATGK